MDPSTLKVGLIFTQAIAEYFDLIDSVSKNVKKLLHKDFLSAKRLLENALNSEGDIRLFYIKEALPLFSNAIGVEENENLVCSFLGMAICQYFIGDKIEVNPRSWTQHKRFT